MKKQLLLLQLLLSFQISFAQKETNIWCFGANVGLDFNSGSPVFFSGVAMNQWEGCASIADANGDLLFYTDGMTVWNKNHLPMPNGAGLLGGSSSTQSGFIIKQPGSTDIYYIFTTAEMSGPAGFNYSTVDITLQGGLGDVVVKNSNLLSLCDERVTAARHFNGTDYWIVTTSTYADSIFAFHFSAAGINTTPVISYNGLNHGLMASNQIGSIKSSQAGDRLGIALNGSPGTFELYDFDNITGAATLVMTVTSVDYTYAYGIEFSPNGNIMYGSEYGSGYNIYQFDLLAGSGAAIAASALLIGTSTGYSAGLQLAPDGKIYVAKWMEMSLAAIENPDVLGLGCTFNDFAVSFPVQCNGGLPNMVPGFLQVAPVALFSAPNDICPGTCTDFTNLSQNATSYLWSFPGANPSVSTDASPTNICYNQPGNYAVTLIASNALSSDTITLNNYITVFPNPPPQGITQSGDSLIANQGGVAYAWYYNGVLIPGATDYFYIASQSGNYNVVATDANNCEVEAVIFDVVAKISDPVGGDHLEVIPNPASNEISIPVQDIGSITIWNSIGEKILEVKATAQFSGKLQVAEFAEGLYFLDVVARGKTLRTKFIKN